MNYTASKSRVWVVIAVMLAIIYFINCFTPFRLTNDTVRYFALKEIFEKTWPADFGGQNDFLPPGYALTLLALSKLGILSSFIICFIQMLFLAGSLNYIRKIFGGILPVYTFTIFCLLNWTTLKFAITPLSEMQFLFLTTGSLYYFHRFNQQKKWTWLLLTGVFCVLAILTRAAGVVLAIALLISFVRHYRRNKMALLISAVVVVVAVFALFLIDLQFMRYLRYITGPLTSDPISFIGNNIRRHLQDWAELFINFPLSKTKHISFAGFAYILAGLLFLVIVLRRLLSKKFPIPSHTRIYIVAYMLLVFNWPFFEARFWFPILPLVVAILLLPKMEAQPLFKPVASAYKLYYVLAGIFVMGYYTWLSHSKEAMAIRHDAGKWEREYRYHFFNEKTANEKYDKRALYLLEKYD